MKRLKMDARLVEATAKLEQAQVDVKKAMNLAHEASARRTELLESILAERGLRVEALFESSKPCEGSPSGRHIGDVRDDKNPEGFTCVCCQLTF